MIDTAQHSRKKRPLGQCAHESRLGQDNPPDLFAQARTVVFVTHTTGQLALYCTEWSSMTPATTEAPLRPLEFRAIASPVSRQREGQEQRRSHDTLDCICSAAQHCLVANKIARVHNFEVPPIFGDFKSLMEVLYKFEGTAFPSRDNHSRYLKIESFYKLLDILGLTLGTLEPDFALDLICILVGKKGLFLKSMAICLAKGLVQAADEHHASTEGISSMKCNIE